MMITLGGETRTSSDRVRKLFAFRTHRATERANQPNVLVLVFVYTAGESSKRRIARLDAIEREWGCPDQPPGRD